MIVTQAYDHTVIVEVLIRIASGGKPGTLERSEPV